MFCQKQVLSKLDFKDKQYEFYIFNDSNVIDENGNTKESKKNLLTNQIDIENIVKTWKGKETNEMYLCGYDYRIYIILNNKIIDKINYNSSCNQVVSNNGVFNVTDNPFKNLKIANHFAEYNFKTKNLDSARVFLKKVKENDKIQIIGDSNNNWYKYDGRFFIEIEKENGEKKLKPTKYYKKEMHDIFKKHDFKVDFWGYGSTYCAYIYSNKEFRDVFNLYGRKGEFEEIRKEYSVYIFGKIEDVNQILKE